jgi:hypothetical protein
MQQCRNGGHQSEIGCATTQELQELEKEKRKEKRNWESRKESILYITFRSEALKMASFCCCETTWRLRVYINEDSDFQRSICWI